MKKFFLLFFLIILAVSFSAASLAQTDALIYKNDACGHCKPYIEELENFLNEKNISFSEFSIVSDIDARKAVNDLTDEFNIPPELQGHMVMRINNLILEGHVPIPLIEQQIGQYPNLDFPKTVIYQDSMADTPETYKIMQDSTIKEYGFASSELISETKMEGFWQKSLFALVFVGGFLAGIHPCTIAVLLFFIAFLFTMRASKSSIFKVGAAYILGVFAAYFLIGLGLLNAITLSDTPHFFAKIAAVLVIGLGIFNILKYLLKGKIKFSFGIPKSAKPKIAELVQKSTIPAALVLGLLVGMCSFGCTAGIYLSILSLLLTKATYALGFIYLLVYNVMFILPLIIILFATSNKRVLHKIEKLESKDQKYFKLTAGIVMIALGIIILVIA